MVDKSALIDELLTLPEGYISKKEIHGKVYFYHQYKEKGKLKSVYLNNSSLAELEAKLARRKEILSLLKKLHSSSKSVGKLSKAAREFDGYLMAGDKKIATFDHGTLVEMDEKLVPFIVKNSHSISEFLSLRVIDNSRTNARLLLKALGIKDKEDELISLYAHGASIGDNYWFKPKHSKLTYKEINFDNDIYSDLSLSGKLFLLPGKIHLSPDLNTRGSLEKGWKKIGTHWWLYKAESPNQAYSELCAYQIAKLIGMPTAEYGYDHPYVKSLNFAERANFEPIFGYLGNNDDYSFVFDRIMHLGKDIAKQYLKLIIFDCLIANVDRHNENYGLMRDRRSGKVISLSPNFDNNLCLFGYIDRLNTNPSGDGLIKELKRFLKNNVAASELIKTISLPPIEENQLRDAIRLVPNNTQEKENVVVTFILGRLAYIKDLIQKL